MQSLQDLVPEGLRLRAALLGINIQINGMGQQVFFVIPAANGKGTVTYNAGESPSEQQLEMTFLKCRKYFDASRGRLHSSQELE